MIANLKIEGSERPNTAIIFNESYNFYEIEQIKSALHSLLSSVNQDFCLSISKELAPITWLLECLELTEQQQQTMEYYFRGETAPKPKEIKCTLIA